MSPRFAIASISNEEDNAFYIEVHIDEEEPEEETITIDTISFYDISKLYTLVNFTDVGNTERIGPDIVHKVKSDIPFEQIYEYIEQGKIVVADMENAGYRIPLTLFSKESILFSGTAFGSAPVTVTIWVTPGEDPDYHNNGMMVESHIIDYINYYTPSIPSHPTEDGEYVLKVENGEATWVLKQ